MSRRPWLLAYIKALWSSSPVLLLLAALFLAMGLWRM